MQCVRVGPDVRKLPLFAQRGVTMDTDPSEIFMWEDPSNFTQRLRTSLARAVSRPPLRVLIPRRPIKVPHQKSKKLQQLQNRPRDPNASSNLLMIAPPSDRRYRSLIKSSQRLKAVVTSLRQATSSNNPTLAQNSPQLCHSSPQMWLKDHGSLSGTQPTEQGYIQQISHLARLAWDKKRLEAEKFRQLYEQATMLRHDPFVMMTPYTTSLLTQSRPSSSLNTLQDYSGLPPADNFQADVLSKHALPARKTVAMATNACPPRSACAVCQMSKQTQPNVMSQRNNPDSSSAMTSRFVTSDAVTDFNNQNFDPSLVFRHNGLKRTRPPDVQQPPAKKIIVSKHCPVAQQPVREQSSAARGAILSLLKTRRSEKNTTTPQLSNSLYFPSSSLQLPTSSYMTSSSTSSYQRDMAMTPSFGNHCFVTPSVANSNPNFSGGLYNGFANFIPQQILNALE